LKRGRSRIQAESYQAPQTSGDVYEEEFDRFAARLRDRTLDFVLQRTRGPKGADDHVFADLNVEVLFDDHLVVAAGKQSRWARRRKIDLAELVNEPWILAEPVTWNYRLISEAFRMRGWDMPRISVRTLSTHNAHEHARFRPFHRHVSKFRFAVLRRALFVEGPASRATNRTVAGGHPDTKRSNTEPGRSGISRSSPQHHDVDGYEAALMAALVE
jgi:LysR substrate binding domain